MAADRVGHWIESMNLPNRVPLLVLALTATAAAQPTPTAPPAGAGGQRVEIKRITVRPIDPDQYRVSLQLEPIELVDLVAPSDGYLRAVLADPGDKLTREAEVARLDNDELRLVWERAKALERAAKAEFEIAKVDGDTNKIALGQARLEAAEAESALAKLRYDRTSVRSPLAGVVFESHARPGRFLRAGDAIATVGDTSKLRVEMPMLRAEAKEGATVDVKVADTVVKGTIARSQPLGSRFDRIRDIVNDAVAAVVVVDNAGGRLAVGQTVHSPLVPREPIALLPNAAIGNGAGGSRRVQVIRDGVIRNVTVSLLAGVGDDQSYVSGSILGTDEVITSASVELVEGTPVRRPGSPSAATPSRPGTPGGTRTPPPVGGF